MGPEFLCVPLVGRFLRNTEALDERQPAVVVSGSWLTVKEQMPMVYGRRLAERGYTALVFDFAGFGESQGESPPPTNTWLDLSYLEETQRR